MEAQKVVTKVQAKIVPVTTRGIGFATQSIYVRVMGTIRNLPICSVYQLYRLSLAQFKYKISRALHNNCLPTNVNRALYLHPIFRSDLEEVLLSMQINFNLLANIIDAVGVFSYGDVTYYPRIPNLVNSRCAVILSNLIQTVLAMSNPQHDRAARVYFYENNQIPGAIWEGIQPPVGMRRPGEFVINPVITNPDEIMPAEYGHPELLADVAAVQDLLEVCSRNKSKFVSVDVKLDQKL